MIWQAGERSIDLSARPLLMGIVNVTPDSFSDGGHHFALEDAVAGAMQMLADGADMLDIGGESTRPGAEPVSAADEIQRVVPVIAALRQETDCLISIDTAKAAVAEAAVQAGADIINDISGFHRDPRMIEVAACSKAGCIAMHIL